MNRKREKKILFIITFEHWKPKSIKSKLFPKYFISIYLEAHNFDVAQCYWFQFVSNSQVFPSIKISDVIVDYRIGNPHTFDNYIQKSNQKLPSMDRNSRMQDIKEFQTQFPSFFFIEGKKGSEFLL